MVQIDMDMPKSCIDCPCANAQDGWCLVHNEVLERMENGYPSTETRPEWCPIHELKCEKWIMVSKKLPKYSDSVLVSTCDHEIDIGSYFSDMWHINGCGPVEDDAVLAWMPLPEPYQEENSGTD